MPVTTRKNEDTDPKHPVSMEVDDTESLIPPNEPIVQGASDAQAHNLAFLAKEVEVLIAPSHDENDTTLLVSVYVNGDPYHFIRGEWRKCPLFVLEVLATAKHQAWKFGFKTAADGRTVQTQDSAHLLRYPHQYRTDDPKVNMWYDSIKNRIN